MRQFNSILAFGDSHVAGCELANELSIEDCLKNNISIEEADEPGKQLAFPKIIADRLGIPCYNYAMTGGSNNRSLRLMSKAVQEHPNSLILFGYTCTDRSEFYYPDPGNFLGRDKDNFIQVGVQWDIVGIKHPINEMFVKHIVRFYNNLEEIIFFANCASKVYDCEIIHLPLFLEHVPKAENIFDYEGYENYITWCQARGFKQLPYYHYEKAAHEELAKLIIEKINN